MSTSPELEQSHIQKALKDAFYAGLITFGLFVLLIGFKTDQNIRNELILLQRWGLLALVVAVVATTRFVMSAFFQPWLANRKKNRAPVKVDGASFYERNARRIAFASLALYPVLLLLAISESRMGILSGALGLFLDTDGFVADMIKSTATFAITVATMAFFAIVGLLIARALNFLWRTVLNQRKELDAKKLLSEPAQRAKWMNFAFAQLAIALLIFFPVSILLNLSIGNSLKWVDNFGIQILIYVMLAWGLNIVVGLAGLLDLGYVAFYAVGAYSYALLSSYFGLSFWILLPLAGILAAFWGVILGFPVLRLRGDYLAIVTLAFGEIIRLVLINWTAVTKGTFGISGIAKATLFGFYEFNSSKDGFAAVFGLPPSSAYYKIFLYYLILALVLLTGYVTLKLRRLPIGRAWEALREDEIACRSLGINTTTTKLTAFAIGAMFGGFAGAFFAVRQGFVSPESFVFLESAVILAIVVLGGMGSLGGIAIAAIVMVGGTELLRQLDFLKEVFGNDFTPELYRMLIFGIAMVVVMLYKPRGFVGTREPTAFLHADHKSISGEFSKEGHG